MRAEWARLLLADPRYEELVVLPFMRQTRYRSPLSIGRFNTVLIAFMGYHGMRALDQLLASFEHPAKYVTKEMVLALGTFVRTDRKGELYFSRFYVIKTIARVFYGVPKDDPLWAELKEPSRLEYKLKPEVEDLHFVPVEDLERMYAVSDDKERLLLLLLVTTGMRRGALARIRGQDIDMENNEIRTVEKGNKVTTYPVVRPARDLIYRLMVEQNVTFKYGSIETILNRIARKAGVKCPHHAHAFRHTYAKMLARSHVAPLDIQALLGHASFDTTKSFYLKERNADTSKRQSCLSWYEPPAMPPVPRFLLE